MILRRVIEHVKTQNWTAVALDFVIVVVGVFIGIQVANWNDARAKRISEHDFLARLHGDIIELQARRAPYDSGRPRIVKVHTIIAEFLNGEQKDLSEAEDLFTEAFPQIANDQGLASSFVCNSIDGSAALTVPPATLPTATELVSAGRVNEIKSVDVKSTLQSFIQQADRANSYIAATEKNAVRLSARFPMLFEIRRHDWAYEPHGEIFSRYRCDYEAMRSDSEFLNAMTLNFVTYALYAMNGVKPVSEKLALLHAAVDNELGVSHGADGETKD